MESSVNPGKFDSINGKRRKLNGRMKFHPKHNHHPNRGNMYGPNPNNYYSQQNPNFCQPQPNIHFSHNSRFQPPPLPNQIHRPIPYHHPHTPLSPESYHQFQPQQPMNNNPNSMPFSYPIFVLDHHCLRNHLPIVNPNYNEQICHQKLMKRHQSLLLDRADLVKIQTLLSDSRKVLERIVDSQGRKYFVQLEDIGSFTKNVLINVRPFVVDLVALMRTIPTEADIENISQQFNKLINEVKSSSNEVEKEGEEDGKKSEKDSVPAAPAAAKALPQNLQMEIVDLPKAVLKISFRDEADKDYSVKLLIGVVYQNLFQRPNRQASKVAKKKAVEGSASGGDEAKDGAAVVAEDSKKSSPISTNILQCRNFAISHVQWFRMNADETTLILIRLLKDVCNRFEGFRKGMNPWMLEVFAKYCCSTPNQGPGFHYHGPLSNNNKIELKDAFYRAFQLLSAGIFLIDSVSIKDPIAFMDRPIHLEISPIHLDLLCATAQTLLRVMNYDVGFEIIVGLKPDLENIAENLTVWDGVYITPSIAVHADDEDEDDQDQDQENQDDEMDELTENVDNKKIDEDANIVDDDETDNDEDDAAATESKENSNN